MGDLHRPLRASDKYGNRPLTKDSQRPNILFIIADDLGYSDLGCYGSEIHTPHIDELAMEGARFTDFQAAAACSPTRAMLLSGTDAHIAGMGVMSEQKAFNAARWNVAGHEGYLNKDVAALPEILQDAGYLTLMSGKWHLGLKEEYIPSSRGFDRSFALLPGCCNHYGWEPQFSDKDLASALQFERNAPLFVRDGLRDNPTPNTSNDPNGFYSSDYFADNLLDYLASRSPADHAKPFFAFLPFTAPHFPLQCPREFREPYKGIYDEGPEVLRQRRIRSLKEKGIVGQETVAHEVVEPWLAEWKNLSSEEKAKSSRSMEVFAGMVSNLDFNVGKVVDYLKSTGEKENTIIIFMSDNGAEGASYEAQPVMGKDLLGVIQKHYDNNLDNIGEHNSFVWYGGRWAQAATAPHRLYKMYTTDGGTRVPFILSAPGLRASAQQGALLKSFATAMDVMPTILDLCSVPHPVRNKTKGIYRDRQVFGMRGKSLVEYLTEESYGPGEIDSVHNQDDPAIGWELFGRAALRAGRWKIVQVPRNVGGTAEDGIWELFDMIDDPGETCDLSKVEPEALAMMEAKWSEYVRDCGVVWGSPLAPANKVEMKCTVGGDPLDEIRNWMGPTRFGRQASVA